MRKNGWAVVAGILFCGLMWAQTPNPAKTVVPAPSLACDAGKVGSDGFTECEELRLAAFALQAMGFDKDATIANKDAEAAQEHAALVRQQAAQFADRVVALHPGYVYVQPSQQYPFGRLYKPQPPTPPPAPAAPAAPAKK